MRVVCLIVSMMMSLFPPSLSAATYEEVTELKMERSYPGAACSTDVAKTVW